MNTLTIPIARQERERLERLALRYGLSLPEFSKRVLKEIASEIPEESLEGYKNPRSLRASFARALKDYRAGRVQRHI